MLLRAVTFTEASMISLLWEFSNHPTSVTPAEDKNTLRRRWAASCLLCPFIFLISQMSCLRCKMLFAWSYFQNSIVLLQKKGPVYPKEAPRNTVRWKTNLSPGEYDPRKSILNGNKNRTTKASLQLQAEKFSNSFQTNLASWSWLLTKILIRRKITLQEFIR